MILGRAFPLHLLEESLLPADSGADMAVKEDLPGIYGVMIGFIHVYPLLFGLRHVSAAQPRQLA